MHKNYKRIKFFILNIIRILLGKLLNCLIKRDENIFLFSCNPGQTGDIFLHNTKYFYLYLNFVNKLKIKTVWLTNNNFMLEKLNNIGLKDVYTRNSLKGIYYALKAKYWFTDYIMSDTTYSILSSNAVGINFWHGIPLKKIGYDDVHPIEKSLNKIQKYIYNLLVLKDSYYNTNSEYEQSCYETAFLTEKEKIQILGAPRLDALFRDFDNQQMFMEEDYNNIKSLYKQGKKLFFYVPTFRDTQKDISGWLKSENLHNFLHENNIVLVCKLHPFDKNSLDSDLVEDFYKMASNSDIYAVLKYSDALISDYSSVAFDYLLLDRPIIYHVPDLQEYQETCRGFYTPYEEFAVGEISYNEDNLISAMQDVINGVDNYKEQRKLLRDKMFKYQDGRNCERVVEWIRSLDE